MSVVGPILVLFVFSCVLASDRLEPFALFQFSVCDYVCFIVMFL